jgi:thioredoxin 1/putative thioredoxin
MPLQVVAEKDFEPEVLRSGQPVLVDFFADWCQPCKVAEPEVEALARELEGKLKVVKVDVDRSPRLAQLLRIQSVPTYMVFAQGRPVAAEQGAVRRDRLRAMVEPFLPRAEGAISPRELAQLVAQQQVVPVDTRDAASFGRAHLPRAAHMPLGEIEGRLAELTMLGLPVLYCRTGTDTKQLAERLTRDGIPAAFLEGGLLAWEAEGLPVDRPD